MSHPAPHTRPSLRTSVAVLRSNQNILIALGLFLALSLLALLFFSPNASADPLGPDAPGLITGVAKNAAGDPLTDIQVTLYRRSPNSPDYWDPLRSLTTQADGKYRFGLLAVGIYRIGAISSKGLYAPLYYPAAPTIQKATDLTITGNQLTNLDLILQPGGQIMGVVTTTVGVSLTYSYVELRQAFVQQGIAYWYVIQAVSLPSGGGVYSFTHLAADVYQVCASGYSPVFSLYECYDNVYDINRAASLTLTVGATISNVNLIFGDAADYAQISGRVIALNDEPLSGIEVYAIRESDAPFALPQSPVQPVPIPTPTPAALATAAPGEPLTIASHGGPGYYGTPFARTDAQGNYRLATLAEGNYRLFFHDPAHNYAFAYYTDSPALHDARVVKLVPSQVVSNVNAQLVPGAHIEGLITVVGQPASTGYVVVEMKTSSGWTSLPSEPIDPNSGRYDVGGLPPGIYRIWVSVNVYDNYSGYYYYQGYFGGNPPDSATEIPLSLGATKTADIVLSGGPQFEGSLAGRVTAGNAPLAGARVSLYGGDPFCCGPQAFPPFVYVLTDAAGRYTINGLTNRTFGLGVTDPTGVYATTYYTNHVIPISANPLFIEDSKAYTNVNVDLPLAGAINGRVARRAGQPVAGLLVSIYMKGVFTPYIGVYLIVTDTNTDAQGQYTVKGLHAGEYYVCFTQSGNNKCYGAVSSPYPNVGGRPVKVTTGATTANIDVIWDTDLQSYLPIIAR